jgi:hypothetical protein
LSLITNTKHRTFNLPQKEEEEFLLPDFLFDIEDDLFTDFENTSNYHLIRKPQQPRNFATIDPTHSDEVDFLKKIIKELISILSDEWLEESEFSNEFIHINSPSITIQCQLDKYHFETLYNPIVGVNIMSATFTEHLLKDIPLAPTNKLLKSLLGRIISSLGILCALPIYVNDFQVRLNFYIFDVWEFDVLIGEPIERLIQEGQAGKINVRLGKGFKLSVHIIHSLKTKVEPFPELESIEEVEVASLEELIKQNLEDDA